MRRHLVLTFCLSFAVLAPSSAWASDAPAVTDNPQGAQYIANISNHGVIAQIVAATPLDGRGVAFTINVNGNVTLDSADYLYHIHELPVPEDGNCTLTKAHLDPYGRGEVPACDSSNPSSCQVGDLSGKHGTIPSLPGFNASYTDDYVSLTPDTPAFMGNRSFVLHYPNKTRIACANFNLVQKVDTPNNGTIISGPYVSGNASSAMTVTSTLTSVSPTGSTAISSSVAKPSVSTVSQSAAGKSRKAPHSHGAVLGPLLLGIAAAVW